MKVNFANALMRFDKRLRGRRFILLAIDLFLSIAISFLIYPGYHKTNGFFSEELPAILILLAFLCIARLVFRVYKRVWRYAESSDYLSLVLADAAAYVVYLPFTLFLLPEALRIHPLLALATVGFVCLAAMVDRLIYKWLYGFLSKQQAIVAAEDIHKIPIAIVGAGAVGTLLAKDLLANPKNIYKPYCFIDLNGQKAGGIISGLKVYSETDILEKLESMPIKEIVIAIPSLTGDQKERLFNFYYSSGFKVKIYDTPLIPDDGSDETDHPMPPHKAPILRELHIEDLLSREQISVKSKRSETYYRDKVVMITGGGGSIGSEICRQVAALGPKQIIIFDIYENNAYDIQQEMKLLYGSKLDLRVEISSVRDEVRVNAVMEQYHPDIVIHAAAHKHVPLMEHNCSEAIKNNVFGTLNVVNAAEAYGVKKFIMVSTDKAVNPTNVMGATKRMCEIIVQSRTESRTEFTAVRFGNVLGSNGSVIPLFKRMIANGGPVTITDKRIIRYFMTIPEASQLVLEAGSMAKNGELYVLDMGKPVQILKLAEDMIRLSGYEPYKDIDIIETGLRPGEKLWEELLVRTEELDKTDNHKIFIERDKALTREEVAQKLTVLRRALDDGTPDAIKDALKMTVPTYKDPNEVNAKASEARVMALSGNK